MVRMVAQGDYESAVDTLVHRCGKEELVQQFTHMLKFRHDRCTKLEENARTLHREIQALKTAGNSCATSLAACLVPCLVPPPSQLARVRPVLFAWRSWSVLAGLFPRLPRSRLIVPYERDAGIGGRGEQIRSAAAGRSSSRPTTKFCEENSTRRAPLRITRPWTRMSPLRVTTRCCPPAVAQRICSPLPLHNTPKPSATPSIPPKVAMARATRQAGLCREWTRPRLKCEEEPSCMGRMGRNAALGGEQVQEQVGGAFGGPAA